MYICDNNESNTDMDDCTMYEILDDVEETTPNVHVVSISMNKISNLYLYDTPM